MKAFVCLTDNAKNVLQKYGNFPDNFFRKIYTGFTLPSNFHPKQKPELPFVFGTVGRGVKEKGWRELIQAFEKIAEANENVKLICLGGSEYTEQLAARSKIPVDKIETIRSSPDPLEVISGMDVSVLPSYYESLPNFIVESLFLSKPVIATNVGEVKEMINARTDFPAGILLEKNPSDPEFIDELAAAMQRMIDNKKEYDTLKSNTRKTLIKFDPEQCKRQYISIFEEVLNSNESPQYS
jgi:glycosyltransferase involved in cell wall biosynthesis